MSSMVRESERVNFLAAASVVAVLVGTAAGLWLPWEAWRIGGLTPLGDFAVLCVLGILVWRLARRSGLGPVVAALILVLGIFAVREVLWRLYPRGLSVLYGIAVLLLLGWLLGLAGYRIYRERVRLADLLKEESAFGLGLGILVLVWFVVGVLTAF